MAPKIKGKPPKQPEVTPDLPSDDLQQLCENNPPENNPGNNPVLETGGENSSSHKTGGPKPGPSKKSLHGRRKRYVLNVSNTVYNLEQKTDHYLKCQHEQRQKLYQDYSLQIMNLNRKLSMDADQVKKQAEKLSNMFKEQRKFIHQSLILQKKRMEGFKSLCEQYLEKLEVLRDSRGNSVAEELRHLIATLEIKLLMVNVSTQSFTSKMMIDEHYLFYPI
ncbi:X-linked lymphocyte-regulated protein 3A-like [Peromyscus californicus insignis]|uniref:X-linked lymphocyte-regulated protein 3A-like n=1 Tax=Peromyscus californicus insignis TaxID=564181 RepID=UPI0022A74A2A|nr:X-linked lymphocyte-regulated protein 3A-like [Peromyscus californicus insignis]